MFVLTAALMLAVIGAAAWFVLRLKQIDADIIATINERARRADQRNAGRTGQPHEDDL